MVAPVGDGATVHVDFVDRDGKHIRNPTAAQLGMLFAYLHIWETIVNLPPIATLAGAQTE